MAKPPSNDERRYQGRVRANMAMAEEAMTRLLDLHNGYASGPSTNYPNQLAPQNEIAQLQAAKVLFDNWLALKGPIPNRPGS